MFCIIALHPQRRLECEDNNQQLIFTITDVIGLPEVHHPFILEEYIHCSTYSTSYRTYICHVVQYRWSLPSRQADKKSMTLTLLVIVSKLNILTCSASCLSPSNRYMQHSAGGRQLMFAAVTGVSVTILSTDVSFCVEKWVEGLQHIQNDI